MIYLWRAMMKEIKLRTANIKYKEPFLYVWIKGKFRLDTEEINEIVAACLSLCNGIPILVFIEAKCMLNITTEGKKYASGLVNNPKIVSAAISVKKAGPMLGAVLFVELYPPAFPVRIFRKKREAQLWLNEQGVKNNLPLAISKPKG